MSAASAAPDPFIFSYAELLLDSSLLKGHEYLEIEIFRRTIYKNIKNTKYLGTNIIKYEYNLYIEDYKILLREIIEDPNKWRKILSS